METTNFFFIIVNFLIRSFFKKLFNMWNKKENLTVVLTYKREIIPWRIER